MPGLVRRERREERLAQQIQVADRVEQLVPDEFIGEAQALGVQYAVLVEHHGIVESAAERKAVVAQVLDLVHEAEGARARDFLEVRGLGEIDFHRLRRALDHRMAEIDREGELVPLERLEARPFVAVGHLNPPNDAQEALRRRLLDDAGLLDEQHEG